MERQPFDELLKAADASVSTPRVDPDLAAKVRSRARRRTRLMAVAAGVMLAAIGGSALWMLREIPAGPARNAVLVPGRAPEPEGLEEIRLLNAEAARHAALADRLCARERMGNRREQVRRELARAGALEELAAERDRTAATLVLYGDQRRESAGAGEEAANTYRSVIAHFSASPSAAAARERLAR